MKTVGLTFHEPVPTVEPSSSEKFTCPHCGKEYKSQTALIKHTEEKHQEAVSKTE